MAGTTTVSKAIFVAEQQGVAQTAAALEKLGGAAKGASAATVQAQKALTSSDGMKALSQATDQSTRAMARMAREAARLQSSLDPAYRATVQLAQVEAQVAKLVDARTISVARGNELLAAAADRYGKFGSAAKAANQNVKLTSGQVQNLGYQVNDIATMLAMGASPFQIMASQAGQVAQALGDGPQGVKGSLIAIGSSIANFGRAIPVAGYAVAGLVAGVGALWYATRGPEARSAEESMKSFEEAIKRLEDGWAGAGAAARKHFDDAQKAAAASQPAAMLDTQAQMQKLRVDYRASVRNLNSADNLPEQILRARSGTMSDAQKQIRSLYTQLLAGKVSASEMADQMLRIRLDPKADDYARAFAEAIRQGIAPAVALEQQIKAISKATDELGGKMGRFSVDPLGRGTAAATFGDRMPSAGRTALDDRMNGGEGGISEIRTGLKAQQDEMLKSRQAVDEYRKSVADRALATRDGVVALQLDLATMGKTKAEAAALRFEYEHITDAKRAAAAAGQTVDPAELDYIREAAKRVGEFTAAIEAETKAQQERAKAAEEAKRQIEQMRQLAGDASAYRAGLFMSDGEAGIAQSLRSAGVDPNSAFGKQYAEYERATNKLEEYRDLNREVWQGIGQDIMNGTKPIEAFGNALKNLAGRFIDKGISSLADNLFSSVFSGSAGGLAAPAGMGELGTAANPMHVTFGGAGGALGSLFGSAGSDTSPGGALGAISKMLNPASSNSAAGGASGSGALGFAGNYKAGVDGRLTSILQEAAKVSGLKVEAFSGLRPGDTRFHGKGMATDIRLFDQAGKAIPNYQNAAGFRAYEEFAQTARQVQMAKFPELNDKFRWGGYFGGPKGKYGALDTMHFDTAGAGMAGGSWAGGLTAKQRGLFPGAESIGMAEKSFKGIETSASSMASSFAATSGKLMPSLTDFASGFSLNSEVMIDGMKGTVGDFLPKFGNNLSSLLDAVSGGGQGSGGGLLSKIIGGISGRTGISTAGVSASLANVGGINGFFADGGYTGAGGRDDIAGLVHAGEYVIPKHVVDRIGVSHLERTYRGYKDGGPVLPANVVPFTPMTPASGGGIGQITVVNPPGVPLTVEAQRQPNGSTKLMLSRAVAEEVGTKGRPANRVLGASGVKQPLRRLS